MKHILPIILLLFFLTNCSDPKPKVVYNDPSDSTKTKILVDSTAIVVAGLPIHYDSTNFLIHPIGKYIPEKRNSEIYMSSYDSGSNGITVAYRNGSTVSGTMDNLKFQHIDSARFTSLTKNQIKIRSFTFLRSIYNSSKKQLILYSITDQDTNKDRKLTDNDIESLFISDINGLNFKKLSPDFQELVEWQVMDIQNRIYFITSEDIDKNGEFDKSDKLHYFFADLSKEQLSVIEYNPIED